MDWNDLASSTLPTLQKETTTGSLISNASQSSYYPTWTGFTGNSTVTTPHLNNSTLNLDLPMLQIAGQSLASSTAANWSFAGAGATSASGGVGGAYYEIESKTAAFDNPSTADRMTGTRNSNMHTLLPQNYHQQQQQPSHPHQMKPQVETLEDAIHRHEQEILNGILNKMQQDTQRATDAMVEAQLQMKWEEDRIAWYNEMQGTPWSEPEYDPSDRATASSNTTARYETPTQMGRPIAMLLNGIVPTRSNTTTAAKVDPALVQAHTDIVQSMKKSATISLEDSIEQFLRILDGRLDPPTQGYAATWRLVAQLVQLRRQMSLSGAFSPLDYAKATLAHFCQQYRTHVVHTVRQASSLSSTAMSTSTSQTTNYKHDFAAQCEVFALLLLGSQKDQWAVLYFGLRCGDAVAALEVAQTTLPDIDTAVMTVLTTLAQTQGNAISIWESKSIRDYNCATTNHRIVGDMLEGAKRAEKPNFYELGVYALLSGDIQEIVTSDKLEGFRRIEDYLTCSLWRAVMGPNSVDELIKLGELIQSWGPSYFEDPTSGGWSFALPLLASQQYQKALYWLARSCGTGLLQAAHIALVLSKAGISIQNLGGEETNEVVTTLLAAYATEVASLLGAPQALVYLMHIPNKAEAHSEVAKLVASSGVLPELTGFVNVEGMREGGAIAEYFSRDEITSIFIKSANILSINKEDRRKVAATCLCFMLAGRYGDLIAYLSELLSPPDQQEEHRGAWMDETKAFLESYIDKRTHVLEVLERDNKMVLIGSLRTLFMLNNFFHRLQNNQLDSETSLIVEGLNLLPTSEHDSKTKEIDYKDLDPLIQQAFPALLVGVMRILRVEHSKLKRELYMDSSGVVRERLRELQEKAKLYTTFAASIGVANEYIGQLTEYASLML